MSRLMAILLALVLVGCGDDASNGDETPTAEETPEETQCPEGTRAVKAGDIVGEPPPEGYELVRGDPAALRRFATQFRGRVGEAWRGYDARVLVRGGKLNGAAVVVINAAEPTGGSDLIQGVEEAAGERDVETQELTIAGREGRVLRAVDGAYLALAPARECAIVFLVADRKNLVVDAASVIPEE